MSECKVYRREFEEAAEGGRVSTGARAHAAQCRACEAELRARRSLRALVGGLGKVEAPADFEFRLRARMAAAKGAGGGGRFGGLRLVYGFAPVAAAACFLVISATLYFRQAARTTPANPPPVAAAPARNGVTDTAPNVVNGNNIQASKGSNEGAGVVAQAPVKSPTLAPVRRVNARARQAGEVASRIERRNNLARDTSINSVITASILRPQATPITIKASAESLRMIVRDERGVERVVPMRTVSFGSQDLLARESVLRQTSVAEVEGVW